MKLDIVIVSMRPGRNGLPVGTWFHEYAKSNPHGFDIELTDLVDLDLPLYNEPNHPRTAKYEHEVTRRWSKIVDSSDAFVFVLPEYNFTAPPYFFNAVDYLLREWAYKPAGFVSYGGISGGLRSVQSAKNLLTTLKVMPIPEQVVIPMVFDMIDDGVFTPGKPQLESADTLLSELAKWAGALKPLRSE